MTRGAFALILLSIFHLPAFSFSKDAPELWRVEGKGSSLIVIGESHFAASRSNILVKAADRWLRDLAEDAYLEGYSPWENFEFWRATCTPPTIWNGALRSAADQFQQTVARAAPLADDFAVSTYIELLPVGAIIWAVPSLIHAKHKTSAATVSAVDSRIDDYLIHKATSSTKFLDDREAELLDVCALADDRRESFLVDLFNWETDQYSRKLAAFLTGNIEQLQEFQRKDVVETARCITSAIPCEWDLVIRKSGAPVKHSIYDTPVPPSIYQWKVIERNKRWASKFDAALSSGGRFVYAMVGIGHLPSLRSGEDLDPGLLELLAIKGYTISPVTSFGDIWDASIYSTLSELISARKRPNAEWRITTRW